MKIFKNNNNQIRSGWKIAVVYFTYTISVILFSIIFSAVYMLAVYTKNPKLEGMEYAKEQFSSMNHFPGICLFFIQCITLILIVILFWKIWDKKKVKYIGLTNIKNSWKDLCAGLLIGAISFTAVASVLMLTKSVELVKSFSQPNFSWSLIIQLIIFIFVGINEELFCRGYCMTVLKQINTLWAPIVISSVIFALMHSFNSGISLLAYVNLFLFGITMGYLFIKTKNIWMGIGYHITWNYFQGNIFGFLVSGNVTDSVYTVKTVDPNIINGSGFGPEGGLVVTILLIISIYLIYRFLPSRKIKA